MRAPTKLETKMKRKKVDPKKTAKAKRALSEDARKAMSAGGRAAQNRRWRGLGQGVAVKLAPETVELLKTVPLRDRKALAHSAIVEAVARYNEEQGA